MSTSGELVKMKVAELRSELEKRGLDTKGIKPALVERLEKAMKDDETKEPATVESSNTDKAVISTPKKSRRLSGACAVTEDVQLTPTRRSRRLSSSSSNAPPISLENEKQENEGTTRKSRRLSGVINETKDERPLTPTGRKSRRLSGAGVDERPLTPTLVGLEERPLTPTGRTSRRLSGAGLEERPLTPTNRTGRRLSSAGLSDVVESPRRKALKNIESKILADIVENPVIEESQDTELNESKSEDVSKTLDTDKEHTIEKVEKKLNEESNEEVKSTFQESNEEGKSTSEESNDGAKSTTQESTPNKLNEEPPMCVDAETDVSTSQEDIEKPECSDDQTNNLTVQELNEETKLPDVKINDSMEIIQAPAISSNTNNETEPLVAKEDEKIDSEGVEGQMEQECSKDGTSTTNSTEEIKPDDPEECDTVVNVEQAVSNADEQSEDMDTDCQKDLPDDDHKELTSNNASTEDVESIETGGTVDNKENVSNMESDNEISEEIKDSNIVSQTTTIENNIELKVPSKPKSNLLIEAKVIPRQKPKSGKFWKGERSQFRQIKKDRGQRQTFEQRLKMKEEKQKNKEIADLLIQRKNQKKEEMRLKIEENKKRKEENERKSEHYQVIKNPAKIKRMKKKQLRMLEKRDTLARTQ